jgi:hypothetical protein
VVSFVIGLVVSTAGLYGRVGPASAQDDVGQPHHAQRPAPRVTPAA